MTEDKGSGVVGRMMVQSILMTAGLVVVVDFKEAKQTRTPSTSDLNEAGRWVDARKPAGRYAEPDEDTPETRARSS